MANSSVNQLPGCDQPRKLEEWNLRSEIETLRKERKSIMEQLAHQKEQVAKLKDELASEKSEKCRLEKEVTTKHAELHALFDNKNSEIDRLEVVKRKLEKEVAKKHSKLHDLFDSKNKEIGRLEGVNKKLKRQLSDPSFSKDEKMRRDLEDEIRRKRSKIKDKNAKIDKLKEDLNSKRAECLEQKGELDSAKTSLEQVSSELKKANVTIVDKENEIRECLAIISNQRQEDQQQQEKIKSLEKQLRDYQDKFSAQEAFIEKQAEIIDQQEDDMKFFAEAIDENKILQKRIENAARIITRQADKLKEKNNTLNQQEEVIIEGQRTRAEMEKFHQSELIRLEGEVNEKQGEIQQLSGEREKIVKFVEIVKVCSEFAENGSDPVVNQLEVLASHIEKKLGLVKQLCTLMTAAATAQPTPPLPLTTSDYQSTNSVPRPSSSSHHQSVAHHPNNENQLCDPTVSNIILSFPVAKPESPKPTTSNKLQPKKTGALHSVLKTTTSIKKEPRGHGENVRKYLPGRGHENLGARYYCFCGLLFPLKSHLEAHIHSIGPKKRHQCDKCPKKFQFHGQLKRHRKETHDIGNAQDHVSFACNSCATVFETKKHLNQHSCADFQNPSSSSDNSSNDTVTMATMQTLLTSAVASSSNSTTESVVPHNNDEAMGHDGVVGELITHLSDNPNPLPQKDDDACVPDPAGITTHSTNLLTEKINSFFKQHGVDPAGVKNNLCLCGVPFLSVELLNNHIKIRSRK